MQTQLNWLSPDVLNSGHEILCDETIVQQVEQRCEICWRNKRVKQYNTIYDAFLAFTWNKACGFVIILYRRDGCLFARRLWEGSFV